MKSSDYKISLDLHASSAPVSIHATREDSGRRLCVTLTERGRPYEISDECYAVFAGIKPDGKVLWNDCAIEDNTIVYEITAQTVAAVGWMPVQIRLYGAGGRLISTPDFVLLVSEPVVENGAVEEISDNEINALTRLIADVIDLKTSLDGDVEEIVLRVVAQNLGNIRIGENGNWFIGDKDTGYSSRGAQGEQGPKGEKGDKGETGAAGPQGPMGPQGEQGPRGYQGEKGEAFTYKDFTSAQLAALKGPKGDKGDKGDTGPKGDQGPKGDSPVPGEDYWTPEEQENIRSECSDLIVTEMAKKAQIEPVFVNSEAECVDQNKVYVLPDGNIYVYQAEKELVANFENKLPGLEDTSGNVYNEKGYKYSTRISSSSGADKTEDGLDYYATGFVPAKLGDVLYLKGMKVGAEDNQHYSHASYTAIAIYGAEKNYLDFCLAQFLRITEGAFELDENGYVVKIDTAKLLGYEGSNEDLRNPDMEFIRIVCEEITDDSIITVNQPIEYRELAGDPVLMNTGHAFVPAPYEDRIIKAETDIAALRNAISGEMAVYGIVDSGNNIIVTGILESGTYTLKYMNQDGTTADIGEFTVE